MRRIRLAAVAAAATLTVALGAAAAPAQAYPPEPCPVHPIVGQNANGIYVWPPGCYHGPIYLGQLYLPPL